MDGCWLVALRVGIVVAYDRALTQRFYAGIIADVGDKLLDATQYRTDAALVWAGRRSAQLERRPGRRPGWLRLLSAPSLFS